MLVCASRASALAIAQARIVAGRLARFGVASTILTVTTTGDRVQDRSLVNIGAQSLFVRELEQSVREGSAHYAVHSCKDVPTMLSDDMQLAAISRREDPRDVFCSEKYARFEELPSGARVGTSSLRRRAQLARRRADLHYADIRGNIDTRLRKLRGGEYDAIVLAAAGLRRLGIGAEHVVPFAIEELVPAVGQGALAVETRADASRVAQQLRSAINDDRTERAVRCERAALGALGGGCQSPIGIHAGFVGDRLIARGVIATLDGAADVRAQLEGDASSLEAAQALGLALAQTMLQSGAASLAGSRSHA